MDYNRVNVAGFRSASGPAFGSSISLQALDTVGNAMRTDIIQSGEASEVGQQLHSLAQSLDAIAGELQAILGESRDGDTRGGNGRIAATPEMLAELAHTAYRDRRRRCALFGDDTLFGEPAWDILLDLFIAGIRQKRVAVTSACIGAAVPTTTALRWLKILEEKGLIAREEDAEDARRTFLRLSPLAYQLMVEYFTPDRR